MAKKQSVQYILTRKAAEKYSNKNTLKSAKRTIRQFVAWCKENNQKIDRNDSAAAKAVIQLYSDSLQMSGKTPATIHTMLAYPCAVLDVPMQEISKPKRKAAAIVRGRGDFQRAGSDQNKRLIDFQSRVGIRRAELSKLTGRDFVEDETGAPCVRVRSGKGGKFQLQRILPGDVETVRAYFDGTEKKLFTAAELENKLNLHRLRAEHAKQAYQYYCEVLNTPAARSQAQIELLARYAKYNRGSGEKWLSELHKSGGRYFLRGDNRQKAIAAGLPVEYDRLALMMVSVFHLSHWRLDVTVTNYMIQ